MQTMPGVSLIADLREMKLWHVLEFLRTDSIFDTYLVSPKLGQQPLLFVRDEIIDVGKKIAVSLPNQYQADWVVTMLQPSMIYTANRQIIKDYGPQLTYLIPPMESEIECKWIFKQTPTAVFLDDFGELGRFNQGIEVPAKSYFIEAAILCCYSIIISAPLSARGVVRLSRWFDTNYEFVNSLYTSEPTHLNHIGN